jgi:hypothetical protein
MVSVGCFVLVFMWGRVVVVVVAVVVVVEREKEWI